MMNEIMPQKYEINNTYHECVGCGFCCLTAPCEASIRLNRGLRPCPQLQWIDEENKYRCELMRFGGQLGEFYRKELHAGAGCCSSLFNSWRQDVRKRHSIHDNNLENYYNPLDSIFQIFLKSLSANFISTDAIKLTIHGMEKHLSESGYSNKEIHSIQSRILGMFGDNQSSFMKDFMG